jgi:hypothetical protein
MTELGDFFRLAKFVVFAVLVCGGVLFDAISNEATLASGAGGQNAVQATKLDRKLWIQNTLVKVEQMKKLAEEQIKKAENSIAAGNKLLAQAQAQGKTTLESSIHQSIGKARDVKRKSTLNQARAGEAVARIRNLLAQMEGKDLPVQGIITHVSGGGGIMKKGGKFMDLRESSGRIYLEAGDTFMTHPNSKVEVQVLEGNGSIIAGPNSRFVVADDGVEESVNLLEGAFRMVKAKVRGCSKKFEVRTSGGTCSVRGTEFTVNVAKDESSEIVLLEGQLEIQPIGTTNTIPLEAGQRLRLSKSGLMPAPENINTNTIARWWDSD